jgi:NAD+ diphosphatase
LAGLGWSVEARLRGEGGDWLEAVDEVQAVLFATADAPPGPRYLLGLADGVAYFAVSAPLPGIAKGDANGRLSVPMSLRDTPEG